MYRIIILISFAVLFSCGKTETEKKNTDKRTDSTERKEQKPPVRQTGKTDISSDDYTVLETGKNMDWLFGKNYKEWIPEKEDIEYALMRIDTCFDDQKRGTANRLLDRKPGDYCMQFMGAVNSNGEKLLWINAFCKSQKDNFKGWKDNLIVVDDGGNCFYNILFNTDKPGEPYKLSVNGNA